MDGTDRDAARLVAGRYLIREPVGQGGMGRVWRAYDQLLGRQVALKELIRPAADLTERLLREARFGARLRHPGIVHVHDVVTDGDSQWIVMELIDGHSLEDLVLANGPLPPDRVAEIGLELLDALTVAHQHGVIHRDVKPANVLIDATGAVHLTDFGIAFELSQSPLTATGAVIGSPQYMAPERVRGETPTAASDLFSVGATLYAAVEGRPPFGRPGQVPTLAAVLSDPPDPVDRAGPLAPILAGLLEKEPTRRTDADTAKRQLANLSDTVIAPALSSASAPKPANRRFRWPVLATAAVLALAAACVVIAFRPQPIGHHATKTTAIGRFFVRTPADWTPIASSDDQPRPGIAPPDNRQVAVQIWLAPNNEAALRDLAITETTYRVERPGYRRISLNLAPFAGSAEGAKWEWTWRDNGVTRRVLQHAVQDQDGRLYVLSYAAPAGDFVTYQKDVDAIVASARLDTSAEPRSLLPVVAEGVSASVPTGWKSRPHAGGKGTDFYRPAAPAAYLTFSREPADSYFVNGYDWTTFWAGQPGETGYQLLSRAPVVYAGVRSSGRWDYFVTSSKGVRLKVRAFAAITDKKLYRLLCVAPGGIEQTCDQVAATVTVAR
ncbi:serine/threonine-protein kinase [Fodinicola acaciae]|uniref:serine/threonine-protein kinase n=1 Tax=Fodinicola acaciae TaxID=2681555 RepID=UPI0013D6BFFD|nr:serine/threonine-protein kinase [Fodinicola acaciae]